MAPETVYAAFRNKPTLLKTLADIRAAGDDQPIPVAQREPFRRILDEPDARLKLRHYAAAARGMLERGVGEVQLVIRAAASADPTIASCGPSSRANGSSVPPGWPPTSRRPGCSATT